MSLLEKKITFNRVEQKYIATCYPLPNREGLDACHTWKSVFRDSVLSHANQVTFLIQEISEPFPHLARLALSGFFAHATVQEYFEGLRFKEDIDGATSDSFHNPNLYLFALQSARALKKIMPQTKDALLTVLDHIEGCSVKPADVSTGLVWGYGGVIKAPIELNYFEPVEGPYVLVHGIENNKHVAIRSIDDVEFSHYTKWFQDRYKSKYNPFLSG